MTILYSSKMLFVNVVPDNERQRDFMKISLEPGEAKTVTFLLFVSADGKWLLEEGGNLLKNGNQQIGIACNQADEKKKRGNVIVGKSSFS